MELLCHSEGILAFLRRGRGCGIVKWMFDIVDFVLLQFLGVL